MNTLVQFAGDELPARKKIQSKPSAHTLFLMGKDTMEIARIRKEPEHIVLRALTAERSKAKGLPVETCPSPYRTSPVQKWRDIGNPHLGPVT
ncbi:hypothetical protein [Mesorhizobium sp. BE184]|uniref:hypothetical protein n=1 Tax=Mesorhizobium sp. BE184 TaxID=2817714 RepID=UPI0028653E56|nr:hypothetical protein [Mesorhizobium sp. BE184]MDR7035242.1 hypothetical protein [Mesorhizobium sp. BE184]